jgi:hypothetical protein
MRALRWSLLIKPPCVVRNLAAALPPCVVRMMAAGHPHAALPPAGLDNNQGTG